MSPKRHIWTSREVSQALEALGFVPLPKRGKGSHRLYGRTLMCAGEQLVNITVSVPQHLGQGTAATIADRVGLTPDQLFQAFEGKFTQADYEALAAVSPRQRFLPPALRQQ
jgi:predicted RNA binding protein YcfA (HicA-like mRNA interferase family)